MKFCKDCKHFLYPQQKLDPSEFGKCERAYFKDRIDPVMGHHTIEFWIAQIERTTGKCGPEGTNWEAK